ncbi:MAG: PP2C family protein-serine/threonine phosphatase [Lachnospiraceae bacterium]|nr:PP2C family protein-serine/threonine phosphatase [Lachnospiraceae bacterium]
MRRGMRIRTKVVVLTTLAMSILTIILSMIGYSRFNDNVVESYAEYVVAAVKSADSVFDSCGMGDLINKRMMDDNYEAARSGLNNIKNNFDIKYLYGVYYEDIDDLYSLCYVINGKSDEEREGRKLEDIYSYMGEPCEEDAFDLRSRKLMRDCVINNDTGFKYYESTSSEYGRLITCYSAITDSSGKAVGVVGADIDVNKITQDLNTYLRWVITAAVLITLIMIAILVYSINSFITRPVGSIAENTAEFVGLMKENVEPEMLDYKKVQVKARDEIYVLSEGVSNMADGVKNYMTNLRHVTAEKERIGAELNVATQIQADMLPRIFPPFPEKSEFDLFATMDPAKEVGGDFYDFFLIDEDHVGLVMADVSGKGVPAALFMVIAKTLIKNRALMGGSPSDVLSYANDQLCEGNEAELFVTVWFGILEISTGKGVAANAGHEHPAIRRKDGKFELVVYRHSPAVATMEGIPFKQHEFELHPGDSLFVYTDGVAEATNAHDELYGTDRMLEALNRNPDATAEELLKTVRESIDEFVGDAPQFDDITMLGLNYFGK